MRDYTNKSAQEKQQFYSQPTVASEYDDLRFGGASGTWVNRREINLALSMVPRSRRVLDLGCGTGRLTQSLEKESQAVGVDASNAMLNQARGKCVSPLVRADAFKLPFADSCFDAVVALRFVFHFARVDLLLSEMERVLAPGGVLVFDTYRWSPRAWLPLDRSRWGGGVYAHRLELIEQAARDLELNVAARESSFLFSPYIYRRLPFFLVRWLEGLEAHLPERLRARVFWKLVR